MRNNETLDLWIKVIGFVSTFLTIIDFISSGQISLSIVFTALPFVFNQWKKVNNKMDEIEENNRGNLNQVSEAHSDYKKATTIYTVIYFVVGYMGFLGFSDAFNGNGSILSVLLLINMPPLFYCVYTVYFKTKYPNVSDDYKKPFMTGLHIPFIILAVLSILSSGILLGVIFLSLVYIFVMIFPCIIMLKY